MSLLKLIATILPNPPPKRPVNDAAVRIIGREMVPLINQQMAINEALEDLYKRLAVEVHVSSPLTDEGRQLERSLIDFIHVIGGRGVTGLRILQQDLEAFTLSAQPAAQTAQQPATTRLEEPAHA
jgi:hypothetical protein